MVKQKREKIRSERKGIFLKAVRLTAVWLITSVIDITKVIGVQEFANRAWYRTQQSASQKKRTVASSSLSHLAHLESFAESGLGYAKQAGGEGLIAI